ncbi:MAG: methyltransferase domain-containing protein [Proteobacteria bacterium]|nr:methyltransferase domain-containing protein [Pseudomonadota bacterium]
MPVRPQSQISTLFAPAYDLGFMLFALFAGGETRLRESVLNRAGTLEGSSVLELFAGTATLSILASEAGAKVTAVDIDPGMLGVAREKVAKKKMSFSGPGPRLLRADAASLPLAKESFDSVIVSLGLHELKSSEVESVLSEAHRVLKKNGRLVLFDFHRAEKDGIFYQKLFFTFTEGDSVWRWIDLDIQTLLRDVGFAGFSRSFTARGALQLISVDKSAKSSG